MSHAIIRTSEKGPGQKFIGRCNKCGQEGLTLGDALEPCPMDSVVSDAAALCDIIDQRKEAGK